MFCWRRGRKERSMAKKDFNNTNVSLTHDQEGCAHPVAPSDPVPTGNIRVVQDPISFKFVLQQRMSDDSFRPYAPDKEFKGVQDAKDWFTLHKQNLKTNPSDLGNINDA